MDQKQIEAWIAANGGANGVQYTTAKKRIPNPAYALTLPDGTPNPQYAPGQPSTIEVSDQQWVNSKTGATLHVNQKDDGSFDVIENTGGDPNKPAAGAPPPRTPEQQTIETANAAKAKQDQAEREKNAAWPKDQDPAYETDDERRARGAAVIKQQGADALAAEERARRDRQEAQAQAEKNRPSTTIKDDGSGGLVAIQTYPDGRPPTTTPIPGVKGQPQQVTVSGVVYEKGPDGVYAPAKGIPSPGTPAEPAGAPAASSQYGAQSASLVRYRDFLSAQTQKYKDTGGKEGITAEQADKLMASRLAQAKATSDEQQGVVNTQTGLYGQQITDRGQTLRDTESRRTAANSTYQAVLGQFTPLLKYMPAGGGQAFLDLLSHGVDAAQQKATAWGGMTQTPPVTLGPAATAANQTPMPGGGAAMPGGSAPPPAAPAAQGTFLAPYNQADEAAAQASLEQANRTANPNAGQNAGGGTGEPPARASVPAQPATPAAAPAAATLPPARPDQTQVGSQIDNAIMPPQVDSIPPASPVPSDMPPGYAPPMTGSPAQDDTPIFQPGPHPFDPSTMVQTGPYPDAPVNMDPRQGPVGMTQPSFLTAYQQPQPSVLESMISDPDMPNEIIARAYQQVYGRPMPGMAA